MSRLISGRLKPYPRFLVVELTGAETAKVIHEATTDEALALARRDAFTGLRRAVITRTARQDLPDRGDLVQVTGYAPGAYRSLR
jgi:hypothetical protein